MSDDQAHHRTAVGERQHRKVPSGSVLGVRPLAGLLAAPSVDLAARPSCVDDLEAGLIVGRYPAMAAERQRRPFDTAGQPAPPKVVMEPLQPVDVDGAVVYPDTLQQAGGFGRPLAEKEGLVGQI